MTIEEKIFNKYADCLDANQEHKTINIDDFRNILKEIEEYYSCKNCKYRDDRYCIILERNCNGLFGCRAFVVDTRKIEKDNNND